jgi:hypothetical protein
LPHDLGAFSLEESFPRQHDLEFSPYRGSFWLHSGLGTQMLQKRLLQHLTSWGLSAPLEFSSPLRESFTEKSGSMSCGALRKLQVRIM